MLVLSRDKEEVVLLFLPDGGEVRIKIVGARYGKARLGFEAPSNVKILREELRNVPRRNDND